MSDLDEDFPLARYLPPALDPQRTPEETVLGYIEAFQTWARDCYHWGLAHKDEALTAMPAPLVVLRQIQAHWCSSRNRDGERMRGGYWMGGTQEALRSIVGTEALNERRCCVSTAGRKRPLAPALCFHLERHAGVWRIARLEAQYGRGPWAPAPL